MTPKRKQAIRKRAEKAMPGLWKRTVGTTRGGFTFGENEIFGPDGTIVAWTGFDSADGTKAQKRANARFIAHARKDIPTLLAEVERLEALAQQLLEALVAVRQLRADTDRTYEEAYHSMFKRQGRSAWDKVEVAVAAYNAPKETP